mmetsp:Transcript_18672/g.58714  ORF Transcript_18672/g.58714 Transcript_18672/m.58714 type:complete len:461 (+) Transcript_18672:173-1555(+)
MSSSVSVEEVQSEVAAVAAAANAMWVLVCGVLVFTMQAGFAMLCAGSVRAKNVKNIMLKNLLDACVGALSFWSLGYGVAYGKYHDGNELIGSSFFFLSGQFERRDTFYNWFFQFAFAATAATIVSGAVAERCGMFAYATYAFVLTAFVYPVVAHWVWSDKGFLSAFKSEPYKNVGTIDFAGCGVVHMVGGLAAGIGAYVLGPRIGRFDPSTDQSIFQGHSTPLTVLGTFLLWVGWYGFNGASTLAIQGYGGVAAHVFMTTTIAAATGCLTTVFLGYMLTHIIDPGFANNGILAGLVGITAGCSTSNLWGAFFTGLIAAPVYIGASMTLKKLEIDDVVDAFPVHGACGAWGVIAAGLFASEFFYANAYYSDRKDDCAGVFYGGDGGSLAAGVVFIFCNLGWTGANITLLMLVLKYTIGVRVSEEVETIGMDDSKHGGHCDVPKGRNGFEDPMKADKTEEMA